MVAHEGEVPKIDWLLLSTRFQFVPYLEEVFGEHICWDRRRVDTESLSYGDEMRGGKKTDVFG